MELENTHIDNQDKTARTTKNYSINSYTLDFIDCAVEQLSWVENIKQPFLEAVELSGACYIGDIFHQFEPFGVTGVVVVSESHFSIHTWPEHGLAVVDILSCSKEVSVEAFVEHLRGSLESKRINITKQTRA